MQTQALEPKLKVDVGPGDFDPRRVRGSQAPPAEKLKAPSFRPASLMWRERTLLSRIAAPVHKV